MLPDRETHGYNGPLKVSLGGLHEMDNLGTDFLDAAAHYDKERGFSDDPNSMLTCNLYGVRIILFSFHASLLTVFFLALAEVSIPLTPAIRPLDIDIALLTDG